MVISSIYVVHSRVIGDVVGLSSQILEWNVDILPSWNWTRSFLTDKHQQWRWGAVLKIRAKKLFSLLTYQRRCASAWIQKNVSDRIRTIWSQMFAWALLAEYINFKARSNINFAARIKQSKLIINKHMNLTWDEYPLKSFHIEANETGLGQFLDLNAFKIHSHHTRTHSHKPESTLCSRWMKKQKSVFGIWVPALCTRNKDFFFIKYSFFRKSKTSLGINFNFIFYFGVDADSMWAQIYSHHDTYIYARRRYL